MGESQGRGQFVTGRCFTGEVVKVGVAQVRLQLNASAQREANHAGAELSVSSGERIVNGC